MNISNKEKVMLCILGIILIGVGYYNAVYIRQVKVINQKIKQNNEIIEKYNNTKDTIKSMEERKSDIKILKAKINDGSLPFYPVLSQEHLIVELDTMLKDSELEGEIYFEPIVSNNVEKSEKSIVSLKESSLQRLVDSYEMDRKSESDFDKEKLEENEQLAEKENETSKVQEDDEKEGNNESDNEKDNKNTVHFLKCKIEFYGTYDGLYKFINTIGTREKKMVVNSIIISEETLNELKGEIYIEIYAVPKISDELSKYVNWNISNTYGKSIPFDRGAATGNVQVNQDINDFVASVKSINSDLPTIMLGKSNDNLRTTYVYEDNNSKEDVEMILTQDDDKYYYKYKTERGCFPKNYNAIGAEFAVKSDNIVLNILSENRVTSNDKSGINLKIINKTDKLVQINISNEDKLNPRVTIEGDGNNIRINQE